MAKKLERYDFTRGGAHNVKYPWDEWLDGSTWQLMQGEDFKVKPTSIRAQAFVQARLRGMRVHTQIVDGTVVIQAYSRDGAS